MQYRFSGQAEEFYSEGIELGIGQEKFPFMESPDGQVLAFTAGVRLFSFNKQNSEIAMLFSFEDNENSDVRCTYRNHDVDIVSVEDNGNVTFLVTGYMNRGTHEGRSGMALYRYDESIRLLEELAFIPTDLEPSLLRRSVARMSHVGVDNELYVMLSDDIVAISSGQSAVRTVIRDAARNAYFRSETGALFARAETETNTGIDLTDFSTGKTERIEADPGTRLIPLGFMREDLVYGVVNDNDIRRDQAGNDVYAMETVRIRDSKGNVLENYSSPGNYVISAECDGNQIRLTRVVFNEETGFYEESTPDQIINTLEAKEKTNRVITVTDDVFEKQVRIDLRKAVDTDRLKMPVPEFQITNEPANDVFNDSTSENTYYVYGTDGYVMGIYADEAVAVRTAAESGMVVVDRYNRYVWERRSMATKNQIMSLTSMAESAIRDEGESSAAFCLKLMLEHRGINRDVEEMLSEGASFTDIVRSGLEEYRPLTLGGCEMNSVLYYVNKDVPVLVSMSDGSAILLIGFNETELVIVDPSRTEGERVYKITRSSGVNLFQNNGNRFFTYYGV